MNIPLLRRIQRQIDKAPDRFLMQSTHAETACGTACCIAGWANALSGFKGSSLGDIDRAERLLGIDGIEDAWDRLFYTEAWPEQFQAADGDPRLPALAIKRIEHFIATEGRE